MNVNNNNNSNVRYIVTDRLVRHDRGDWTAQDKYFII